MQKPFPIPVNYFSIVLGLLALGLAWREAEKILQLSTIISSLLLLSGSCLWLVFTGAYVMKWLNFRAQALNELHDAIRCCFISLIPITTILVALALLPYQAQLAFVLITLGIVGQLLFAAYRSGGLWRGMHQLEATTPIIYLPTVATNFISASALGHLGYQQLGLLFWGSGCFIVVKFRTCNSTAFTYRNTAC